MNNWNLIEFFKEIFKKLKKSLYILIPFGCIAFWALVYLIRKDFILNQGDFTIFYNSGKQILEDPSELYKVKGYLYTPAFACFFVLFTMFELAPAHYIFYTINYLFAIFTILEFNRILQLNGIIKKFHRFLFLIVISNGWVVYYQFYHNQSKLMVILIIIFILRREVQYRVESKTKDLQYYIINYGLFVFTISIVFYLIFFANDLYFS